jgi:glyoxylase-like metal-dependent hydrolase (beta-lactamase superfamily II)
MSDAKDGNETACCDRRSLLRCGAYVAASLAAVPALARWCFAEERPAVVTKPFARVEKLADGVWAVVSTPRGPTGFHTETVSNGGIVQGKDRVIAIEGFNTPTGAAWLSELCKTLTGRYPDQVVLTHFHGDHSAGLPGYQRGGECPEIVSTLATRESLLMMHKEREVPKSEVGDKFAKVGRRLLLPDTVLVETQKPTVIDLGGRTVTLVPRAGHTSSDLTIVIDKPHVVFCGDLYFNRLFPNYGDATPTKLNASLKALQGEGYETLVPGHGAIATPKEFATYIEFIGSVEDAARVAIQKGTPAAEAWKTFRVPERLGKWGLYRPDIARRAFEAWERELKE